MIILKDYLTLSQNNYYNIISNEQHACPKCGGSLKVRDSKRRKVILNSGEVNTYLLRRFKCTQCGVLHLELPDVFIPHKHYSRKVIETALVGTHSSCPAENSTIYRWNKERDALLTRERSSRRKMSAQTSKLQRTGKTDTTYRSPRNT